MGKAHDSKIDAWIAFAMLLPIGGAAIAFATGAGPGPRSALWIGAGSLALYGLLLWAIVLPMRYTVEAEGLRVQAGALNRLFVPWDRLGEVTKSTNPLSSPALSVRRLRVEYRKADGKPTFVLISPRDRDAFLRDLAQASPHHRLDADRLVTTRGGA